VFGVFNVTLFAPIRHHRLENLVISLASDVPGITSKTNASGNRAVFT